MLRDLTNLIVHLRPAPVVARVQLTFGALRGLAWARAEMDAAHFLTAAGAPVAPPASDVDPGPHEVDGLLVTFWAYVDHDLRSRTPRSRAGRCESSTRRSPRMTASCRRATGSTKCESCSTSPSSAHSPTGCRRSTARRSTATRTCGNVLWTRDGPLWSDLENICRGPREFDLACLRFRPSPEADAAIEAYGEHDAEAVERALGYVTLFLAAVTPLVAERVGDDGARRGTAPDRTRARLRPHAIHDRPRLKPALAGQLDVDPQDLVDALAPERRVTQRLEDAAQLVGGPGRRTTASDMCGRNVGCGSSARSAGASTSATTAVWKQLTRAYSRSIGSSKSRAAACGTATWRKWCGTSSRKSKRSSSPCTRSAARFTSGDGWITQTSPSNAPPVNSS